MPAFDHAKDKTLPVHQSTRIQNRLSNLNNFHSLEVVDRFSKTQFQVGENSN